MPSDATPTSPTEAPPKAPFGELGRDPELLGDFILESREHLTAIEIHLLALDQDSGNSEAIHAIYRGFHTIKGLAGFLELAAIQQIAHEVETVLDLARNGQISVSAAHIDVILASKDYLGRWMSELEAMLKNGTPPRLGPDAELLAAVHRLAAAASPGTDDPASGDTVPSILSTPSPAELEKGAGPQPGAGESDARPVEARAIKVDTAKLDYLVEMVGEMVIAQSLVKHDPDLTLVGKPRLSRNLAQLARISGEVQRTAMSMRMIPIRQLFQKMARLVHDLSRKTGKQVELEVSGEETELDRNIVEELADPLMHMVRNAIDHGIEPPAERLRAGKDATARVLLKAGHHAGNIVIEVSDNGRGLNEEKILRKARQRGLIAEGVQLPSAEVFDLIFHPGFSTAEQVTAVSGRGVGMDVVRKQIQKLRGKIEIQSAPGQGASFFLKLPLTLAIIDGLVVGVGTERYVVPLFAVREMLRPAPEMLSTVEDRDEMVLVRGCLLPVVRLHRRFDVRPVSEDIASSVLIVTESGNKRFCLMVDKLVGKQEVVIKSLGEAFSNVSGVAGGAILGDGRVGLILDPQSLFGDAA